MLSVARIPFYSIKTFYFRQVLTCFITKGSLQTRLTYNRGCFTKSGWLTNEGGLQTKVAYKRRWLSLFCPDPYRLSYYLETEGDSAEDKEEILLDDVDGP